MPFRDRHTLPPPTRSPTSSAPCWADGLLTRWGSPPCCSWAPSSRLWARRSIWYSRRRPWTKESEDCTRDGYAGVSVSASNSLQYRPYFRSFSGHCSTQCFFAKAISPVKAIIRFYHILGGDTKLQRTFVVKLHFYTEKCSRAQNYPARQQKHRPRRFSRERPGAAVLHKSFTCLPFPSGRPCG